MEKIIEKISRIKKTVLKIGYLLFGIVPNISWWCDLFISLKNKKTMETSWLEIISSSLTSIFLIFMLYLFVYLSKQIKMIKEMKERDYPQIAKVINTNAETLQKIKEHYVLKIEMPKDFQDKEYMQQFSANIISAIQDIDKSEYKQQLPDMPIFYIQITPEKSTNDNTRNI